MKMSEAQVSKYDKYLDEYEQALKRDAKTHVLG